MAHVRAYDPGASYLRLQVDSLSNVAYDARQSTTQWHTHGPESMVLIPDLRMTFSTSKDYYGSREPVTRTYILDERCWMHRIIAVGDFI